MAENTSTTVRLAAALITDVSAVTHEASSALFIVSFPLTETGPGNAARTPR